MGVSGIRKIFEISDLGMLVFRIRVFGFYQVEDVERRDAGVKVVVPIMAGFPPLVQTLLVLHPFCTFHDQFGVQACNLALGFFRL